MPSLSNSGSQQDLQNSGPQDVQQQANYYEQMQKQQHAMYQAASSGQGSRYLPLPPEQQQEMYGSGHQRQVRQTRIPSFSGAAPFRTSPFAGNPSMAIRELRGIGMPQSVAVGGLSPQRPPQRFAAPPVYPPPHPQLPISAAAPGSIYAKSIASAPFPMDATPYNPMQNQVQAQSTPSLPQAATNASAPGIEELMDENKYLKMRIEFLQEGNDKLQSMLADTRAELSRAQESMAIALSSNPSGANPMGLSLDNPVVAAAAAGAAAAATEALKALASQSGYFFIRQNQIYERVRTNLPSEII